MRGIGKGEEGGSVQSGTWDVIGIRDSRQLTKRTVSMR